MAYDTGYSRRSSSERDLQAVAIVSVDPTTRTAIALTRTRHSFVVNCAYATGDTITVPAAGEQWYVERIEMEWRLYGRIPFNDPTLTITPEEGQVSVGSASGPLELNGTEVRANGTVFRLNGVYYRDSGTALQRSTDKTSWTDVSPADAASLIPIVANALTNYQGSDQPGAVTALKNWAGLLQALLDNFSSFWGELCNNVFIDGLKRMGFGDNDLAKVSDGLQNFADYLFGVIFCDFDGHLTPQTALARIRDLLAPIVDNPFVQGLQAVAEVLGVALGNLLNDIVAGATTLLELIFNIVFCRWEAVQELLDTAFRRTTGTEPGETSWLTMITALLDLATGDNAGIFNPAAIFAAVFGLFDFIGGPNSLIGMAARAIAALLEQLIAAGLSTLEMTGNLLQDALQGLLEFLRVIFEVLTCGVGFDDLAALLSGVGTEIDLGLPGQVLTALSNIFGPLTDPGTLVGSVITALSGFAEAMGLTVINLFDGAIKGAVTVIDTIYRLLTCGLTPQQADSLTAFLTGGDGLISDILSTLRNVLSPLTDATGLVGGFLNGLKQFAEEQLGLDVTNLLDGAIQGAVGLIQTVIGVITCDPDALAVLAAAIPGVAPGTGTPLAMLSRLGQVLAGLLANPLVATVQALAAELGLGGLPLIDQLLSVTGSLWHWVLKVVTSILPFGDFWSALLAPLGIDWSAVDAVELPDLSALLGGGALWAVIFKPLDDLIATLLPGLSGPGFVTMLTNFTSLFPVNFFDPSFDPLGAITAFVGHLGDGLQDWFNQTVLGGATSLFGWLQGALETIGGLAGGDISEAMGQLAEWARTTILIPLLEAIFGPLAPILTSSDDPLAIIAGFFTEIRNFLGILDPTQAFGVVPLVNQIFGAGLTEAQRVITRLVNLFGGLSNFTTSGSFDFAAAATALINTVLTQAPSAAVTTLTGLVQGVGSLAYEVAKVIIEAISKIPLVGPPAAATVKSFLDNFVNLGRGNVASGSNLLADPKVDNTSFWSATGLATSTAFSRSTTRSLELTSAGSAERTFDFTVNDLAASTPLITAPGSVFFVECYILAPTANATGTATITLHGKAVNLATSARVSITATAGGTVSLVNPTRSNTTWYRMFGYFTVPSGYDGFVAGITLAANATTSGTKYYIDDMLVQDVTGVVGVNTALYGTPLPATTVQTAAIPSLDAGKIGSGQFTGTRIADLAISSGKIADSAVVNAKLAVNSVTGDRIVDRAVTGIKVGVRSLSGGATGNIGTVSAGGSLTSENIQELDASKLQSGTPGAPVLNSIGVNINPTSGSGAQISRRNTNNATASENRNVFAAGFYDYIDVLGSDVQVLNSGNAAVTGTGAKSGLAGIFRVLTTGWYAVELCFNMNPPVSFGGKVGALIYRSTNYPSVPLTPYKAGSDGVMAWWGFGGIAPRTVQNMFIVHLPAGGAVRAGYDATGAGSNNVFDADSDGTKTYFSISLLNKTYA